MAYLATREAYGEALAALGEERDFLVLDADLSKATYTMKFARKYPERFFNMGISEEDLMTTAAGIASTGKTVFASTFAMFAAGRAYEQIRNSIAYTGLNVKIGATHGGTMIGEDGASHQCIEDISLMRTIPGMTVIVPCDQYSVDLASVKPLDRELVEHYAAKTGRIITAEDHNVIGGLGGAVAEVLSETATARLRRVGMQDVFGCSGTRQYSGGA